MTTYTLNASTAKRTFNIGDHSMTPHLTAIARKENSDESKIWKRLVAGEKFTISGVQYAATPCNAKFVWDPDDVVYS